MKRANQPEEKAIRRASILSAARTLLEDRNGEVPTVSEIAREAGVAKGTVYLYFRSREAIELAMLSGALHECFDLMESGLAAEIEVAELLDHLVEYLAASPVLVRLGSRYNRLMEENADFQAVVDFKKRLFARLDHTGRLLETRIPELDAKEARHLMMRSFSAVVGLWQLAEPVPIVRDALEAEGLTDESLDFRRELPLLLKDLWSGTLSRLRIG